jgi:hypothetical protein
MTDPNIQSRSRPALPPPVWVELVGGVIVIAIVVGFLTIVLTSIHW